MTAVGRALAGAGMLLLLLLVWDGPATAHPLGNFTTNRYSGLAISPHEVRITYVVDMAEIPTIQELQSISGGDPAVSQKRLRAYADKESEELLLGLTLLVDGRPVAPEVVSARALLLPGQGGLEVLRTEIVYAAPLPSSRVALQYTDLNYTSRLGWKEVVAHAVGDQGLVSSSVPSKSISDELRAYPRDLLQDPPQITTARVAVAPGASGSGVPVEDVSSDANPDVVGDWFTDLIARDLSPAFVLAAVLIAAGAGALHALQPGHGKTILAAYLVGSQGRLRDALLLGVAVSLMHTASVVALGLTTLWASSTFAPESVYPWLSLISGVVVIAVGAWLLRARLRSAAYSRPGAERPGVHHHVHPREPGPSEGASPFTPRGLVAIALSGGLLPSPAALIVLLGAISLGRVAFGISLVGAFSLGLAAALTAVGLLVIRARDLTTRRMSSNAGRLLSLLSAGAIVALGVVLTARAALSF